MAFKDQKISRILLEEVANSENRCRGYQDELREAITEILQKERAHLFRRSNIVVEIEDIINRASTYVNKNKREE